MYLKAETYDSPACKSLTLKNLMQLMSLKGVQNLYVKKLAPNDNSKNQPYFGGHLTDLSFLPTGDMIASPSDSKKQGSDKRKIKFTTSIKLSWVDAEGSEYPAPHSKLIYYPQYPEVRFSGFLRGSQATLSRWMSPDKQGRSEGRWLILGVADEQMVYGYLVTPESKLAIELEKTDFIEVSQVFKQLDIRKTFAKKTAKELLLEKLLEIHEMGWIPGQRLDKAIGGLKPYKAINGGGYTLESLLEIYPNGIAEPDYLGWEIKQFGVKRFPKISPKLTTLMTPEPDGGFYSSIGVIDFVKTYGYPDKSGKPDRLNFGGKHVVDNRNKLTNLTLTLNGFDFKKSLITDAMGAVDLVDVTGNVAASWSFAKLMNHWKRKHAKAAYIPCMRRTRSGIYEYSYGNDVELGIGTSFEHMLTAMSHGTVYYDPGIKVEKISTSQPKTKRRSQFRVNHKHLDTLYNSYEFINVKQI